MSITRWKNAPGTLRIAVFPSDDHPGQWINEEGNRLPWLVECELNAMFPGADAGSIAPDLELHFASDGYSDPGSYDYRPEGEDDRRATGVSVDGRPVKWAREAVAELAEMYQEKIDAAETR